MSSTAPDVDVALLAAAQTLPPHFADSADLAVEPLDAIQATTMSLPGGAFAVESVIKGSESVGAVVLIVTGLIDHANGEVFSRDEARTLWSAALGDCLTSLGESLGEMSPGQTHMTDAFDALDAADEATVVGVFNGQVLAGLLLAQPSSATGQGAAAELAAAVAAAEAEANPPEEPEEDADADADADASPDAAADPEPEEEPAPEQPAAHATPDAAAPPPGYGYPPGAPMPPGYGYPPPPQQASPAAQAAAQAAAAAYAAANPMEIPQFQPLAGGMQFAVDPRRIDLLRDVIMGVSVELGRTRLTVQEILGLTPGSIVELDRAAGAPVDVLVNGTLIAHGEVVVVDEEFAVRIADVVSPDRDGRASG